MKINAILLMKKFGYEWQLWVNADGNYTLHLINIHSGHYLTVVRNTEEECFKYAWNYLYTNYEMEQT